MAGILVLASCQNPFTSDYEDRIASVDSIGAPDSASALIPFQVTIATVVPNGCWAQGHDDVQSVSGGVNVTPFDKAYTGKNACTQVVVHFRHQVTIRLPGKGAFTLSVKTRLTTVSGADSIAVLTRTIQIQ